MKRSRLLLLWTSLLAAFLSLALLVSVTRAAKQAAETSHQSPITLVVDNSAGMAGEVAALSAAWQERFVEAPSGRPEAGAALRDQYKLISFRDEVDLVGETDSSAQMGAWLSALETGGDGNCRDDALRALAGAARLAPQTPFSHTSALLLSDSAPYGSRAALARVINLLVEQDVVVHPVIGGWCPGATLPPKAMEHLAAGTGGPLPLFLTDTQAADLNVVLGQVATPDLLLQRLGGGAEFSDSFEIPVDSTIETMIVDTGAKDTLCDMPRPPLTCTRGLDFEGQATVASSLALQVRDPEGTLMEPGMAGVSFSDVSGLGLEVNFSSYPGAKVGTFTVEISGVNAAYELRVSARSGASMNLLSRHTLPAGQIVPVRVGLLLPTVQARDARPLPTEELFGAYNFRTGQMVSLHLNDDGQSGDGAAGDGVYGGLWQPPAGVWQLLAWGELADGSRFQRVEPAPIRVLPFDLRAPGENQVMPGDNVNIAFTLDNDSGESRQFELDLDSSQNWAISGSLPASVTLAAGESRQIEVPLAIPEGTPAGMVEETRLTALAPGDDPLASSMATATTRAVDGWQISLPLVKR